MVFSRIILPNTRNDGPPSLKATDFGVRDISDGAEVLGRFANLSRELGSQAFRLATNVGIVLTPLELGPLLKNLRRLEDLALVAGPLASNDFREGLSKFSERAKSILFELRDFTESSAVLQTFGSQREVRLVILDLWSASERYADVVLSSERRRLMERIANDPSADPVGVLRLSVVEQGRQLPDLLEEVSRSKGDQLQQLVADTTAPLSLVMDYISDLRLVEPIDRHLEIEIMMRRAATIFQLYLGGALGLDWEDQRALRRQSSELSAPCHYYLNALQRAA